MIDSILNLLFRCPHRRLSRPLTPPRRAGAIPGETYVVCLDCGKQFSYDVKWMRIGRPLEAATKPVSAPSSAPLQPKKKLGYTLAASVPAALFFGAVLRRARRRGH